MARLKAFPFSDADRKRLAETMRVLEDLRAERKAAKRIHCTIDDLAELVPSYRNALYRPENTRPLTREEILVLCKQLECTSAETNHVLLAGNYTPIEQFLTGARLERALAVGQEVLDYLPLPGYVITQDWHIQRWNEHILRLTGLRDAQARMLQSNRRLSVLHFIFDIELGMRGRLRGYDGTWEEMAARNVYAFKVQNLLCQHDEWFKDELERLLKLPDFTYYWSSVSVEKAQPGLELEFISELHLPDNRRFRFRSLFIANGSLYYPQVAGYLPVDEESREVFRSLGIPGW